MLTSEVDVGVACGDYFGSFIDISLGCRMVIVMWDNILMGVSLGVVDVLVGVRYFSCGGQGVVDHCVGVVGKECVFGLGDVVERSM